MFTVKLKRGHREIILEAESFTVLRERNQGSSDGPCFEWDEITLHRVSGDIRYDVGNAPENRDGFPDVYDQAFIENSTGKTVAIYGIPPGAPRRRAA